MRVIPSTPNKPPLIAIVGEAPGKEEAITGKPFVGQAGKELTRMLNDAGIVRDDCFITNLFHDRPPDNDLKAWCVKKKEADELWFEATGGEEKKYPLTPLAPAAYLRPEYFKERLRLWKEIENVHPNLVIALGNTACWALLDSTGIKGLRGTVAWSTHIHRKVIPTWHPAAVLRDWSLRVTAVADLMKARREAEFREVRKPEVTIWIEPTIQDIKQWLDEYVNPGDTIAIDIETNPKQGQITCVGFGTARSGICIPFVDKRTANWSYWETKSQELEAWTLVKWVCENGRVKKVLQNGLYDIQWLWRKAGIAVMNYCCDTQYLHHSLQPEMPKDLGFLGSLYTNFPSWKHLRTRENQTTKREE